MSINLNFEKNQGFVTAIAQDWRTGKVLMVGHANPQALEETLKTGLATWWSMSRNELWTKGLTSGDTLKIKEIRTDCDKDAVLYLVEPQGTGGACHKEGWFDCFGYSIDSSSGTISPEPNGGPQWSRVFQDEEAMILSKADEDPQTSYTAKLLQSQSTKVAQKIGEEAVEVALAIVTFNQGRDEIVAESADLLYHLQVGWAQTGISLQEVESEIVRRRK